MGNGVENEEIEEKRKLPSDTEFRSTRGTEGWRGRLNRFGAKNLNAVRRVQPLRFRQEGSVKS